MTDTDKAYYLNKQFTALKLDDDWDELLAFLDFHREFLVERMKWDVDKIEVCILEIIELIQSL